MAGVPRSEAAIDILRYLTRAPHAQDTFDGIVQWWSVDRERARNARDVRLAVEELVTTGFLVATRGRDEQERYRMNPALREEAQSVVAAYPAGKDG